MIVTYHQKRNPAALLRQDFFFFVSKKKLLAKLKSLDDSTISFDINVLQVVEHTTTLTYKKLQ